VHADRRTDRQTDRHDEANIRVRNFADANEPDLLVIWKVSCHEFVDIIV